MTPESERRSVQATVQFVLDGRPVTVPDLEGSLLDVLREELGSRSVKDGCSPQGQCGCCTVLVDGMARVSCVTPVRRVAGRSVTTVDGLDPATRSSWSEAFLRCGASQCGFCTPGIIMRLVDLERRRPDAIADADAVCTALLAHLCRCTGWQTIVEAAARRASADGGPLGAGDGGGGPVPEGDRDPLLTSWRATLEGTSQLIGPQEVLGAGGFADDRAPGDAAVALVDAPDGYAVAPTRQQARAALRRPPGRRSTVALGYPLEVPPGDWAVRLRTTWVEPAYLELDASWCRPGGSAATTLANGGAFGGKQRSPLPGVARRLADEQARPVRALWSREDVVRYGPKRPPIAAGLETDGTGVVRVARTPRADDLGPWVRAMSEVLPRAQVEVVDVPGPPVSPTLRAAGWAEGQVLRLALGCLERDAGSPVVLEAGDGARVEVELSDDAVCVDVWAGEVLDPVTLRSYVIGAVHQALGWVWQEGVAVDGAGEPVDLTIRSFGVLTARQMPDVDVRLHDESRWPVRAGDAVFAATAAAAWSAEGMPPDWPTRRGSDRRRSDQRGSDRRGNSRQGSERPGSERQASQSRHET